MSQDVHNQGAGDAVDGDVQGDLPDDAFISPDEPIVRTEAPEEPELDEAFIDPDEPIVRKAPPTKPEDFERVLQGGLPPQDEEDDVVVTGIGNDPHLDDPELKALEKYGDPHVADLVEKVGRLADALRQRGEAGLKTEPDMSRFEASLRAYCTGYLAARREGEDE